MCVVCPFECLDVTVSSAPFPPQELLSSIAGLDYKVKLRKTSNDLIRDRSAPNLDARLRHTLAIS